ncbi:MAG: efflux RND transporter periplasmic adaptor subunit [Alteromonadaceae bacterium]|nr:efflux RND transporter periplasmic adaptor subunit [Alteromonadaceae bacterium]
MKILTGLVSLSLIGIVACTESTTDQNSASTEQSPPAKPVTVMEIQPQDIALGEVLPGRVEAVTSAEIRPQVSGVIQAIHFEQGSMVTKGQQLYQIDDAKYKTQLQRAQANLQNAQAELDLAKTLLERSQSLASTNTISQQELDNAQAREAQAKAAVALSNAEVEAAKIDLTYTKVYAPISGYIGPSAVTQGALVTARQIEALAVVRQIDPIYVDVSQTASKMQHLQTNLISDRIEQKDKRDYEVQLFIGESDVLYPHKGHFFASELAVDPDTGMTRLRMRFENPDSALLPGMYVRARIMNSNSQQYIVVPQKAVSIAPDGSKSVWLVKQNNRAQKVQISTSGTHQNNWIVNRGLKAGDKVIVEGTMMLKPDAKVTPQSSSPQDNASSKTSQADDANNPATQSQSHSQ